MAMIKWNFFFIELLITESEFNGKIGEIFFFIAKTENLNYYYQDAGA